MPFEGQFANKTAHGDVVRNPVISQFLEECESLDELEGIKQEILDKSFVEPPPDDSVTEVDFVLSSDGSSYTSEIDNLLPSSQVCYLKFSTLLLAMDDFAGLRDEETKMIDPFKVAALQRNRETQSLILPLSNFRRPGDDNVKTTFRREMDAFLRSEETQFSENDPETNLMATLIDLSLLRPDLPDGKVKVHKCPNGDCEQEDLILDPKEVEHSCSLCGKPVFISDCLRLWETINDYHPNQEAATRFMNYVEHLLPIHNLLNLAKEGPEKLSGLAIFIDGPLAIFGQGGWLHKSIMHFLSDLRNNLLAKNLAPPLIIGLQKTGRLIDYLRLLDPDLPPNRIFSVTDDFRYKYLGVKRSREGFGSATYYGHDFAFKSSSGKLFVIGLPYPFASKTELKDFSKEKSDLAHYPELPRALRLVSELETDLYKNSLIPIALAHRHASISLRPGGRILDTLARTTRSGLSNEITQESENSP